MPESTWPKAPRPNRRIPLDADEIARRYTAGESIRRIAVSLGVGDDPVRKRLAEAGVPVRPRKGTLVGDRVKVDDAALVARYIGGESEKALAAAFGIDRNGVRRRLLRAGVTPRGRSEAMYVRMGRTSLEERARLASAAHDAVRGKPVRLEAKLAHAATVELLGANCWTASPAEQVLADMLRDAGLPVIHQKAIGPYNVDLATGTVAVEVLGGQWHRAKKHRERLRYILDAGWDVVYIWVSKQDFPLGPAAARYVVTHVVQRGRNPGAVRCYRVIRGDGRFLAGGSIGDELPDLLPISDRPEIPPTEVPFGCCHCGCGRTTAIAKENNARMGWVRGQPVRYISGHNKANQKRQAG